MTDKTNYKNNPEFRAYGSHINIPAKNTPMDAFEILMGNCIDTMKHINAVPERIEIICKPTMAAWTAYIRKVNSSGGKDYASR